MLHHRLLVYLDEVARCGTMRAASRKLNVASSAINRQILSLEGDLGTPIFERLPRKLRLTAAGEVLLKHVRETLRSEQVMQARINDLTGLLWGRVSVATVGTVAAEVMPRVIADFRARYPRCTVDVRVVGDPVLDVQEDEVDLGIGFDLATPAGIKMIFEVPVTLGAVVAPGHELAGRVSTTIAACAGYPLVLPNAAMSMRPLLDQAFDRYGGPLLPTIETNSIELMKKAVQLGQGVAFLTPLNVAAEREGGQLIYVPLRESGMKTLFLRCITKTRRLANPLAPPLIRQCEETILAIMRSVELPALEGLDLSTQPSQA